MPGKVLEAKTFVSVLLFVSVHFLYSWLLPAVQGSKEAKGGIVKEYIDNDVKRIKRKGIRLRACFPCVIPFYIDNDVKVNLFLFLNPLFS
ncbi:MAG: hypothetical protein ACLUDQ_02880 [Bilophila wadsworthia]